MNVVEFMVEDRDEYTGNLPYEIVESTEYYDVYRVETDDVSLITVIMGNKAYQPDKLAKFKGGYYVSVWKPIRN